MKVLDWLTDKLQVKVLIAMLALAGISMYCIYAAITTDQQNVLIPIATFAMGAMGGIAKDLLAPAPGPSEGYLLAKQLLDNERASIDSE